MNETIDRDVDGAMVIENSTIALLNKGEIDMQIATAQKYPRSITKFRQEMMQMVTLTEKIAQECIYSLPRDGKVVEGPSARFAEVAASAWGNCRAGARVVNEGPEFVTAQGVFHDLQRNVAITFEVQRRITGKNNKRYSLDMIGVTGNAASSIALRNAILKGIPKAFWADMYDAAKATVMGDFKTLANRRADAIKAMQAFGVTPAMIFETLGVVGIEDITREHLVTLGGLMTALKEGETTVEQAFAESAKPQSVRMPQAKKPADIDATTGEIKTPENTAPAAQESAQQANEAAPISTQAPQEQEPVEFASDSQQRVIKTKMSSATLTDGDLKNRFGFGVAEIPKREINNVLDWISNPAGE